MPGSRYHAPDGLETRSVAAAGSRTALGMLKIEGLSVKYTGPGESDSQAATTRTNHPAPPDCPLYYFEVKIVSRGAMGYIGLGFQTESVLLNRLPGWEPHSYGYHGDDGHVFNGHGRGRAFGPTFTTDDVVGALLNHIDHTISFFKNGADLGVAFTGVTEDRLFPCVGLRSRGEHVALNLGLPSDPPFVTDVSAMVAAAHAKVLKLVNATPLPLVADSVSQPLLPHLLYVHLLQHRCWRTAELIRRDLLQLQPSSPADQTSAPASAQAMPGGSCTAPSHPEAVHDVNMGETPPALPLASTSSASTAPSCPAGPAAQPQDLQAEVLAGHGPGAVSASGGPAVGLQGVADMVMDGGAAASQPSSSRPPPGPPPPAPHSPLPRSTAPHAQQPSNGRPGPGAGARMGFGGMDKDIGATEAEAGSSSSGGRLPVHAVLSNPQDMQARQAAYQLVDSGRPEEARALVTARYGGTVLEQDPGLDFRLKVAQFCELLRPGGTAAVEAALAYGRAVLTAHHLAGPADEELLSDALSLLAYEDPLLSPCGHLLRQSVRSALAEDLNQAMLVHLGLPRQSPLERLAAQTLAVMEHLRQMNHPQALLLEPSKVLFSGLPSG